MAEGGGVLDIGAFIDALCVVRECDLGRARLGEIVLESARLINAVLAYGAMVHDVFDRQGDWAGATSSPRWVAARTGSDPRVTAGRRRDGVALRLLPAVAERARSGELSSDHVGSLSACVDRHPDRSVADEGLLLGRALETSASEFRATTRRWIADADVEARDIVPVPEPVSDLSLVDAGDGGHRPEGWFTAEDSALLGAGLDAGVDRLLRAARDGDPSVVGKPVSVLRAQVLLDLVAQSMRREPSERSVPDRYRVPVIIRHDAHCPGVDATHHATHGPGAGDNEGGAQGRDGAPMPWCDSNMFRAVIDAAGQVLDIGRDTPRWSPAIRRAVTLRDGGCVFPGCDRPPGWCDVHHCQPWDHGGHTKVDNGALLCRSHHTFLHANHWKITFHEHRPRVHRSDGSLFTITRWQTDAPPPQLLMAAAGVP